MSSEISRTICRRSSRVRGVRSSASCSVTARSTRSARSSFVWALKSSGPSLAMQAWWGPIVLAPPEHASLLSLRGLGRLKTLGHLAEGLGEIRARLREDRRVPAVDRDRHRPVRGDLETHLDLESRLDL